MDILSKYLSLPITDPTWIFFLVLCVILLAPMIFNKLHIPNLIGMILAGVVIGENGCNLLARDASFELFGKVGIYFIMFLAGLEMDLQSLKQNRTRGFVFGLFTTAIPFAFGFVAGYYFLDYTVPASLLLACILASHTLVAYPIVGRYGLSKQPAVTISVVATMFALMFALMFLAGIEGTIDGNTDAWFWLFFVLKVVGYGVFLFWLMPKWIRIFFRRYSDHISQFIFTLSTVFLAAATAEICGLEGILGAFLAGLVLNRFVPSSSPLMSRIEFVGNALFIPYFLIGVGMLVNISPLFHEGRAVAVVAIMVIAGTVSKYIAAFASRKCFKMTHNEGVMMFGLTEAHAAGALAMVMVGVRLEVAPGVPLMDNAVLDGVVMMILLSCIISSMATDQAAKQLKIQIETTGKTERKDSTARDDEKILVPIKEPSNIETLMQAACLMRNRKLKRGLICLNIVNDTDLSDKAQEQSRECLALATKFATAADVPVQTQTRLAVNFVTATIHALRENDASEVLIGLHHRRHKGDSFLGQFAQGLIDGMSRQLTIVSMKMPANTIRRIVVTVPEKAEYEKGFYRWINRVARMAEDLGCAIEFHAHDDTTPLIRRYMNERHSSARSSYAPLHTWEEFLATGRTLNRDHLFVVITARRGGVSWQSTMNRTTHILAEHFAHVSLMLIYPDQQEKNNEATLFEATTIDAVVVSDQTLVGKWLRRLFSHMG